MDPDSEEAFYAELCSLDYFETAIWKSNYQWLQDRGYQLRDRFSPNWVPSYIASGKYPLDTLDGRRLKWSKVVDAIRISDGKQVALKYVDEDWSPYERELTTFFSSPEMRAKPGNHCVELLEILSPPPPNPPSSIDATNVILFVFPLLRPINSPQFTTFGEALDFFRQFFEGIRFLHQHHVAHRDLNFNNVMFDPTSMYPKGFHPAFPGKNCKGNGSARSYTRTARPPRYIIIDFGLSMRYEPGDPNPLAPIHYGGDKTVPEFQNVSRKELRNPFHTDIYYAGNLIRECFDKPPQDNFGTYGLGFNGFEFIRPLVSKMVQDDPSKRPTIDEVIDEFEQLVKSLSNSKLRSRLIPRKDSLHPKHWLINPVLHFFRTPWHILSMKPAIPMRGKTPYES